MSAPPRSDPASALPAPAQAASPAAPRTAATRSCLRTPSGTAVDIEPRRILEALADPRAVLWLDIDSTDRHQHALLEKVFRFHPLAIEDTLNPDSRVKVEAYDGYLFTVLRAVRFCETTPDPYDLETTNLCLFLGPNYIISVHSERSEPVDTVAEMLRQNPDLLDRGPARIMHMIVDTAVDAFFPVLDKIDDHVDDLERRVFERFEDSALEDIFSLKRAVLSLRRYLSPQREVLNVLSNRPSPLLPGETQLYFRDVYDHMLRLTDMVDNYRELLGSTLDSYLSQVNNRLGMVTKGLTVVATLSVPFVVVSGMWGMNFEHIPLAGFPHGFWIMLVLQLVIGAGLIALLKWRKWL